MKDFQMILELKDLFMKTLKNIDKIDRTPPEAFVIAELTRVYNANADCREKVFDSFMNKVANMIVINSENKRDIFANTGINSLRELSLFWINKANNERDTNLVFCKAILKDKR